MPTDTRFEQNPIKHKVTFTVSFSQLLVHFSHKNVAVDKASQNFNCEQIIFYLVLCLSTTNIFCLLVCCFLFATAITIEGKQLDHIYWKLVLKSTFPKGLEKYYIYKAVCLFQLFCFNLSLFFLVCSYFLDEIKFCVMEELLWQNKLEYCISQSVSFLSLLPCSLFLSKFNCVITYK